MNIRSRFDRNVKILTFALLLGWLGAVAPSSALAQADDFTLTVTPPLFQVSVAPGDTWKSAVKVVNSNDYPISVVARPVNFEATGEEGRGSFVPLLQSSEDKNSLGGWIGIQPEPVTVPAGQTASIPFVISVPEDASPGGHYAALLISNQSGEASDGTSISIASSIASLLFFRVAGEIEEEGLIRSFSAEQPLYQEPEATFDLRFQNLGNVHLRPQGTIVIYNMWGKERGHINLNHKTEFGNVLPGTVRKFTFTWRGEESLFDIGRYTAQATLSYGKEERVNVVRETIFWIIPIWTVVQVLGGGLLALLFIMYAMRRYVARALRLEAERLHLVYDEAPRVQPSTAAVSDETAPGVTPPAAVQPAQRATSVQLERRDALTHQPRPTLATMVRPLKEGATDLRNLSLHAQATHDMTTPEISERLTLGMFMRRYALFFIFVFALLLLAAMAVMFMRDAFVGERDYEVTVPEYGGDERVVTPTE